MNEKPRQLQDRLEPFVDDHLIGEMKGAQLRLHQPQPAGTVLEFDRPWEGVYAYYSTVIRDGDVYRMYYRGAARTHSDKELLAEGAVNECTCYAESTDGIHWTRPEFDFYEFTGAKRNNIVLAHDPPYSHNFAPFLDANPDAAPDERYKAVGGMGKAMSYFKKGRLPLERSGLFGFASGDGIHWKKMSEQRIFDDDTRVFDSLNTAFWSPAEGRYVFYYRQHMVQETDEVSPAVILVPGVIPGSDGAKTIARATSPDFLNWSGREIIDWSGRRPTRKECLYTNGMHPYFRAPHISIGLAMRFMQMRSAVKAEQVEPMVAALKQQDIPIYRGGKTSFWHSEDCCDTVFLSSRGGNRIDRTFREGFVRPGPGVENWTTRTNGATRGMVQTGPTEMSLYIHRNYGQVDARLERLTLRLDGVASVNAPYDGGEMTTKPFTFTGEELVINYATSAAGGLRVEVLDAAGSPLPGFALADCDEIFGDEIERVVSWNGAADLARWTQQPVRLRFTLKDADLYSLRFRKADTGKPAPGHG